MKTIPLVPASQNTEELQKITDLICECVHPDMVVLLGHYAGMKFANVLRGYELLILIKDIPSVKYREIVHYINVHYPLDKRKEKNLFMHLFSTEFVSKTSSQSHFLTTVRRQGILLFKNNHCELTERIKYKPIHVYQCVRRNTEPCLAMGKALLLDAKRNFENKRYRLTAFYLYHAAFQFVHAVTLVHYGFIPNENEDLPIAYSRIRFCSKELSELWGKTRNLCTLQTFGQIMTFYYWSKIDQHSLLEPELLSKYLQKLQIFEIAADHFCTERFFLLESLQY